MAEALDNYEELNRLTTELEKNPTDPSAINAIFRITHTLKGNAAGMGFSGIAELSHTLETLFGEIRSQRISLTPDIFTALFKSMDVLGALIRSLQDGSKVSYKGIKTKAGSPLPGSHPPGSIRERTAYFPAQEASKNDPAFCVVHPYITRPCGSAGFGGTGVTGKR